MILPTPEDTRELGRRLADLLVAGDLVLLTGLLGAGKTVLVQGIGAGLNVDVPVTSPTFVIARVHAGGRLPLVHVDAYRLGGLAEINDLDLDAAQEESVTVVEWGAGLVDALADSHLEISLDRSASDESRRADFRAAGGTWPQRVSVLTSAQPLARPVDSTARRADAEHREGRHTRADD